MIPVNFNAVNYLLNSFFKNNFTLRVILPNFLSWVNKKRNVLMVRKEITYLMRLANVLMVRKEMVSGGYVHITLI